jgi:transposase
LSISRKHEKLRAGLSSGSVCTLNDFNSHLQERSGFIVVIAQYGRMGNKGQVGYPGDVSDEEWAFVAPYLALCREDAAQRTHSFQAVFNAQRWLVKTGAHWRMMPNDLPPWPVVYQQTRRWIRAGCFEIMVEDLRSLLREFAKRKPQPTAMVMDRRTLQSTPESGARAGYDGAKRPKGSKVHAAVGTLGIYSQLGLP